MTRRSVPRFSTYLESVERKTQRTRDELWAIARREGFVRRGKFVARPSVVVA